MWAGRASLPGRALLLERNSFVHFSSLLHRLISVGVHGWRFFFFFNKSASSRSAPALQQQDCTGGFPSALGNEPASGCREPTKSHLTRNFLFYKIKVAPWDAAGGTETQAGLTQREIILEVKLEGFSGRQTALLSPKLSSSYLTLGD